MSAIDYRARVKRGAVFLDDLRPGWERVINLDHLELADSCRCVLGQLFGHYLTGLAVVVKTGISIGLAEMHSYELGFNVPASEMHDRRAPTPYRELDELWISEIEARLRPAQPVAVELPAVAECLELQPA